MKQLTILVPDGENNISSIAGAYKIFTRANALWQQNHGKELFKIQLAGISTEVKFHDGLFSVRPQIDIASIEHTDLIIVPSLNHNYEIAIKANQPIITWLQEQYRAW